MIPAILLLVLIFCLCVVVYTYVIYPAYVIRLSSSRARTQVQGKGQKSEETWPVVSVLMAAHNEESVLNEKLASLAAQDYRGIVRFFIGSDNSSDATNQILNEWAERDDRFLPSFYTSRQGKPNIINQLAVLAGREGVYLITDASVMLRANVITELVRPMLENERIGVVDATMVQTGAKSAGIGLPEEQYINREVALKRAEGQLWGTMIGPFGGCWALRAEAFQPVPPNFLVDDFFLCMAAYEAGFLGVSSSTAVVEEAVGQSLGAEFRRKVRISSGNWQNLSRFYRLWLPPGKSPLAFALFSHKILRWWTPFFVLLGAASSLLLGLTLGNHWAGWLFVLLTTLPAIAILLDYILALVGIHFKVLRGLRYFLAMNAALLVGFYRYLTGIKSNVWQPSQRH